MTKHMIVSFCNTLSLYIGVIWKSKDVFKNNIWFGMMVVLHNSNVLKHGTLWPIIHDLLLVTRDQKVSKLMCWNYFASGHGKRWGRWGSCPFETWNSQRADKSPNTTIVRCSWHCLVLSRTNMYVTMCLLLCRSL
jgi:hypothetical protein